MALPPMRWQLWGSSAAAPHEAATWEPPKATATLATAEVAAKEECMSVAPPVAVTVIAATVSRRTPSAVALGRLHYEQMLRAINDQCKYDGDECGGASNPPAVSGEQGEQGSNEPVKLPIPRVSRVCAKTLFG